MFGPYILCGLWLPIVMANKATQYISDNEHYPSPSPIYNPNGNVQVYQSPTVSPPYSFCSCSDLSSSCHQTTGNLYDIISVKSTPTTGITGPTSSTASNLPIDTTSSVDTSSVDTTSVISSSSTSSTSSSSAAGATGTPCLTKLLGEDNRPKLSHIVNTRDAANDQGTGSKIFQAASTLLLALTKVNSEGAWIKSMFDLPPAGFEVNEGGDNATVVLLAKEDSGEWKKVTKFVERKNLSKCKEFELIRDPKQYDNGSGFKEPWWPWALIEAALQAGWHASGDRLQVDVLLHMLTGHEAEVNDNPDEMWLDTWTNIDNSPMIVEWQGSWSAAMSMRHQEAGDFYLFGWADPWLVHDLPADTVDDGELTKFSTWGDLKINKLVHLKGFPTFDGRPDNLD